jgi:hypothetical protein
MKSAATFIGLLLTLLLGVGIAFIRPTQPVQIGMVTKPTFMMPVMNNNDNVLDNNEIVVDMNIQPARKCKYSC